MSGFKRPESVLVVIYTGDLQVLLLERADFPGYWQSVTGSLESNESCAAAAQREVFEETGIDTRAFDLDDWRLHIDYEIYPQWRHRYAPGVTVNREHAFGLRVDHPITPRLAQREHVAYGWFHYRDAMEKVFSPSNRDAIATLPQRLPP